MKLRVEIEGLAQWAGPTSGGDPFVLSTGSHDIETKDEVLIQALCDAHRAYVAHSVGVVVISDDPAWRELVLAAEEREEADREAEERRYDQSTGG